MAGADSRSLGTMMALVTGGLLILVILLICTCVLLKKQMTSKFEKDKTKRREARRSAKAMSPTNLAAMVRRGL